MKTGSIPFLLLLLSLTLLSPNVEASEQKKREADRAAGKWLALVDGGAYSDSWYRASALFRQQVGNEQWSQTIRAVREPLGAMISRKLVSADYLTSLPGAPDGEYVVLRYRASFERKKDATETVTPMLDNGHWRVSGYYLR